MVIYFYFFILFLAWFEIGVALMVISFLAWFDGGSDGGVLAWFELML